MTVIVAAEAVSKSYSGARVLDAVDFDIRPGEVHALIGENGAGKSTLIRILSGDTQPDTGGMAVRGTRARFRSPVDARASGIVTIFQELAIVPEMSVAENIVLGAQPTIGRGGQAFSRAKANAIASDILARLAGAGSIEPGRRAGSLSTAEKQIVEIARALALDAPVLIMDEPTASLSVREADALLSIIRGLADAGTAIIFVSHRLEEIRRIADRVTVLRGGVRIGTYGMADKSTDELIELMVGRPLAQLFPPRNRAIGDVALEVRGITRAGVFEDVSFSVRHGEVLGFAGLVGAGRTEVMRAVFGLDPIDRGEILLDGRALPRRTPRAAIRAGFGFVPEDRKEEGLVLPLSARENLASAAPDRIDRYGIVDWRALRRETGDVARALGVRGAIDSPAARLSGGNQQKIVIGKWMMARSRVLVLDEPTRGVDVGAKADVYRLVHELAASGAAILMVSSELPELVGTAHRILVMSGGRVEAEFGEAEFDEARILQAAFRAHLGHAAASPGEHAEASA
ncbi:MAG: sugar ABC transporter ATP-binding protein [Azospirillaceae bacterium]